jgi:hypothetical protein
VDRSVITDKDISSETSRYVAADDNISIELVSSNVLVDDGNSDDVIIAVSAITFVVVNTDIELSSEDDSIVVRGDVFNAESDVDNILVIFV